MSSAAHKDYANRGAVSTEVVVADAHALSKEVTMSQSAGPEYRGHLSVMGDTLLPH